MTGVEVTVWPGIAPQWPELAVDGPLLTSPSWLRARIGKFGDEVITVVVSQDGEARLAALGTVLAKPATGEFYDLHYAVASPAPVLPLTDASRAARVALAAEVPPPERWAPSLIMTLPGSECVPVGPGRRDAVLLRELVGGAMRWAEQRDVPTVAFLYTYAYPPGLDEALGDFGFMSMPLSRTWVLPVPAGGLDEYLADLPKKKGREAARELRRLTDADVRVRRLDPAELEDEATLAAMAALRAGNVRKYRGKADELRELGKVRGALTDICGGRAIVFAAEADGDMLGFALFCPHIDTWFCLLAGFNYADERSRFCYFATVFYTPIPAAAQAGVRTLAFGQGSAGAKKSRGCVGLPLSAWIRSADPAISAAVKASAEITELEPE